MNHSAKSSLVFKLAAVAAALSLQGVATAANEPAPAQPAAASQSAAQAGPAATPHGRMAWRGEHHRQMAMIVPGYGALGDAAVKVLDLNASQAKLLADAQAAQKESWKTRYEAMKGERENRFEQLKSGKIDPRAAQAQADAQRGKAGEARQAVTEKWLAVWDALDTTQQQKAATLLGEQSARRGRHGAMKHDMRKAPRSMQKQGARQ